MSERKFDKMMNENDSNNEYAMTVEGVETYHRPVWQKVLSAAAAFAVIAGGIGTAAYLLPKANASGQPAAEAEEQMEVQTLVNLETLTETADATEPVTSAALSNDDMRRLFEESVDIYFEAAALSSDAHADADAEPIQFWRYWGKYDESLEAEINNGMKREGDSLYYPATYYKVRDPRSTDINELKNYYSQYIYEPEREFGLGFDVSDCAPGSVIYQEMRNINIIGYNGSIYSTQFIPTAMPVAEADRGEIICDKPLYVTDTSFTWERIYKVYNAEIGGQKVDIKAESIQLDFEKMSDGSWKVTNGDVAGDEYDSSIDYYALDTVFSNWGGAYISDNMGIDFGKADNNVTDYISENIHREKAFFCLWERTDTLPENYEHITDDYVNDNNWLKFTYREAYTTDGPIVDIYTDCNGTIFAVANR